MDIHGANLLGPINMTRGSIVMHATTMNLWELPNIIDGTGSAVTITSITNAFQPGSTRILYPVVGSIITNNSMFEVDGNANYTAEDGDRWEFEAITTSTYKVHIMKNSGVSGYSGYSGYSGSDGIIGVDGKSGYSGSDGVSGYSGYSGSDGIEGKSGYSGYDGVSGYSGYSGYSGSDGISGYSGSNGIIGAEGDSGYSGYSGSIGVSGYSGSIGADGDSGYSGYSGKSGYSGYSGVGVSGYSGYSGYSGVGVSGYSGSGGAGGITPNIISSTPVNITAAQCLSYIHYVINTAATILNLPDISTVLDGAYVIFYMKTAYTLTIDPYASDRIILNGEVLTDGDKIVSSGNIGDYIALHKDSNTGWTVVGRSGLWVDGGI